MIATGRRTGIIRRLRRSPRLPENRREHGRFRQSPIRAPATRINPPNQSVGGFLFGQRLFLSAPPESYRNHLVAGSGVLLEHSGAADADLLQQRQQFAVLVGTIGPRLGAPDC